MEGRSEADLSSENTYEVVAQESRQSILSLEESVTTTFSEGGTDERMSSVSTSASHDLISNTPPKITKHLKLCYLSPFGRKNVVEPLGSKESKKFEASTKLALFDAPVYFLRGFNEFLYELFRELGIDTIETLAKSTLFNKALSNVLADLKEEDDTDSLIAIEDSCEEDLHIRLRKLTQPLSEHEIMPGVESEHIDKLRDYGLNTVLDLALFEPFHRAQTIYHAAHENNSKPKLIPSDIDESIILQIPRELQFGEASKDDMLITFHFQLNTYPKRGSEDNHLTKFVRQVLMLKSLFHYSTPLADDVLLKQIKMYGDYITEIRREHEFETSSTVDRNEAIHEVLNSDENQLLANELADILIFDKDTRENLFKEYRDEKLCTVLEECNRHISEYLVTKQRILANKYITQHHHSVTKRNFFRIALADDEDGSWDELVRTKRDEVKVTFLNGANVKIDGDLLKIFITKLSHGELVTAATLPIILRLNKEDYCIWSNDFSENLAMTLLTTNNPNNILSPGIRHFMYDLRMGTGIHTMHVRLIEKVAVKSQSKFADDISPIMREIGLSDQSTAPSASSQFHQKVSSHGSITGPDPQMFLIPRTITIESIALHVHIFHDGKKGGVFEQLHGKDINIQIQSATDRDNDEITQSVSFRLRLSSITRFVAVDKNIILSMPDITPGTRYYFTGRIVGLSDELDGELVSNTASATTLPSILPEVDSEIDIAQAFTVFLGSCFEYHNEDRKLMSRTYEHMYEKRDPSLPVPHIKFHVGDQVYLDVPTAYPTWHMTTKNEITRVLSRDRYLPSWIYRDQLQFLGANYNLSDDHEFYNDYPYHMGYFHLIKLGGANHLRRHWADEALKLFNGLQAEEPGVPVTIFTVGNKETGQLSFCMADTRVTRQEEFKQTRFIKKSELTRVLNWIKFLQGPGILVLPQPILMRRRKRERIINPAFDIQAKIVSALQDEVYKLEQWVKDNWKDTLNPLKAAAYAAAIALLLSLRLSLEIMKLALQVSEWAGERYIEYILGDTPGAHYDNLVEFKQYKKLARAIAKSNHDIVLLSGDKHYARLSSVKLKNEHNKLIEVISSPLAHIKPNLAIEEFPLTSYFDKAYAAWTFDPGPSDQDGPYNSPKWFPQLFVDNIPHKPVDYIAESPIITSIPNGTRKNFATVSFWRVPRQSPSQKSKVIMANFRLFIPKLGYGAQAGEAGARGWNCTVALS